MATDFGATTMYLLEPSGPRGPHGKTNLALARTSLLLWVGRAERPTRREPRVSLWPGRLHPFCVGFPGSLCCCPVSVSVLGAAGGPAAAPQPEQEPICGPCFSFLLRPKGIHPRAPAGSRVRGPPSAQGPQQAPARHPLARRCPWARGFRL